MKLLVHACSVTAYTLQDDALQTGELDYINGGKSPHHLVLENSYLAPHTLCYFICPSEHHARLICRFH
jgi:hypothetical protein